MEHTGIKFRKKLLVLQQAKQKDRIQKRQRIISAMFALRLPLAKQICHLQKDQSDSLPNNAPQLPDSHLSALAELTQLKATILEEVIPLSKHQKSDTNYPLFVHSLEQLPWYSIEMIHTILIPTLATL